LSFLPCTLTHQSAHPACLTLPSRRPFALINGVILTSLHPSPLSRLNCLFRHHYYYRQAPNPIFVLLYISRTLPAPSFESNAASAFAQATPWLHLRRLRVPRARDRPRPPRSRPPASFQATEFTSTFRPPPTAAVHNWLSTCPSRHTRAPFDTTAERLRAATLSRKPSMPVPTMAVVMMTAPPCTG
jgi:hypothetical protein